MSEILFELKNACFSYAGKFPALESVNLRIGKGERVVFLGANGTGKSTLLSMLDGLFFPDKGEITAFGRQMNEQLFNDDEFSRFFRQNVGFVFQSQDIQLFCPSVEEDIVFGPLQMGLDKNEIKARLTQVTEFFAITHLLDRAPHQLSAGEKRKVALASVLILKPRVLILDEPTAGLDPKTARQIVDLITEGHMQGNTIITATHDLHIVEEIADVVYVLGEDKRIVRSGAPCEILSDADFLQENNLVHIHSHAHKDKTHVHPHTHTQHHA